MRGVQLRSPDAATRAALGLPPEAQVWRVERLRLAGGVPMALEIGWFPAALLPALAGQDLSGSLYALLAARYGVVIDRGEQSVWAETTSRELGTLLGVPAGAPVMVFRRTSSAGGTPVEHVTSWYRGDRYQVHMDLERRQR